MSEIGCSLEATGSDLLNQLEHILANDNQLDEVGFTHPSQFGSLNESSVVGEDCECVDDGFKYDESVFWHRDHKLGISTKAILVLYKAAKVSFFAALECYKRVGGVGGESDVLKHSAALVLLSSDFGTAWNSRKMIVSKAQQIGFYMDELYLSDLVLSYAPKSDQAWSHRRWVIKMIAGEFSNVQDMLEKESRLVERIAEISCELEGYRAWSGLHAADSSCFHYRRRLLLGLIQRSHSVHGTSASICCSSNIQKLWKEELDWNELLIKQYIGREALWLHRRFLTVYYVTQIGMNDDIIIFIENELHLINSCIQEVNDYFEDANALVTHAATYALLLRKQITEPHVSVLTKLNLRSPLTAASPEKILLWDSLLGLENSLAYQVHDGLQ